MNPKGRNDYCQHCEEFNTILDGLCCICLWHVVDNRQSTEEEQNKAKAKLDTAINQLNAALEDDDGE